MRTDAAKAIGRRLRRSERGWSLMELLFVISLLIVVTSAALALLDKAWALEPADQEWAHSIGESQVGVYRITRELRQGTLITVDPAGYIVSADVREGTAGTVQHVLYQCDQGGTCTRKASSVSLPPRGAGGAVVVPHTSNQTLGVPVFSQPSSNYYQVTMKIPSTGSVTGGYHHTITYSDGFLARNN